MPNSKYKILKIRNYDWKKLFFELIVVFLGVTAGFLLNNWQLEKQDERLEEKYLNSFLEDVNANISDLESLIESDSVWLSLARPKLMEIKAGTITLDSATSTLRMIVNISKSGLQSGTYENITNSGSLNIIGDYNLRKQIVDYHDAISGVGFIEDYFYQYFGDFVMPFIFSNFSVLRGQFSNPRIIKDIQFQNVIAGYYSMIQQRKKAYEGLLEKSYQLQKSLEPPIE